MDRTTQLLTVAAAIQLGLAGVTWFADGETEVVFTPVIDLELDAIDRLEIYGGPEDDEPVMLAREADAWVLPELGGYPADSEKVREVLTELHDLRVGRPVASQPSSHASLSVAEGDHERRVVVGAGDTEQVVYLGASGGRSVHVRKADASAVFTARGLNVWSFAESPRSWFSADLVDVDASSLGTLSIRSDQLDVTLVRNEEGWTLGEVPEGTEVDQSAVDRIARNVTRIRMTEPVGREVLPAYGLEEGVVVEWTTMSDVVSESGGFRLGAETGEDRYLRALDSDWVVRVSAAEFDELRALTLGELLQDAP